MRGDELLEKMEHVDEKLVEKAGKPPRRRRSPWWAAAAAVLVVVAIIRESAACAGRAQDSASSVLKRILPE